MTRNDTPGRLLPRASGETGGALLLDQAKVGILATALLAPVLAAAALAPVRRPRATLTPCAAS